MLPITSVTTAVATVALIVLSFLVSQRRMAARVDIGLGSDEPLLRRVRAQGNFVEYVPIGLILLALAELRQAPVGLLYAIAGLLIVGRALHAAGMLKSATPLRAGGMLATYVSLLLGAGTVLLV